MGLAATHRSIRLILTDGRPLERASIGVIIAEMTGAGVRTRMRGNVVAIGTFPQLTIWTSVARRMMFVWAAGIRLPVALPPGGIMTSAILRCVVVWIISISAS